MTEKFRNIVQSWYDKVNPLRINNKSHIVDYITDDLSIYDLGVDSMDEMELIMDIEVAYNITISDNDINEQKIRTMSFKELCDWVENKRKGFYNKIID